MTFGILSNCLKDQNPLLENGFLKPNGICKAMLKCIIVNTQKKDINYKETSSTISTKDFFIIIIAPVAHNLELH